MPDSDKKFPAAELGLKFKKLLSDTSASLMQWNIQFVHRFQNLQVMLESSGI